MGYIRGHKLCPSHSLACVPWFFWLWLNNLKQETSPTTWESRETRQQAASPVQGLCSVGTRWLLCSAAGQPELPLPRCLPRMCTCSTRLTLTLACCYSLREPVCFQEALAPDRKCKLFVSSIMDLFITTGKRGCVHIWNVNWELLIQKKKVNLWELGLRVFRWIVSQISFPEPLTRQCHHVEQY